MTWKAEDGNNTFLRTVYELPKTVIFTGTMRIPDPK
jgi:hypothetical protein